MPDLISDTLGVGLGNPETTAGIADSVTVYTLTGSRASGSDTISWTPDTGTIVPVSLDAGREFTVNLNEGNPTNNAYRIVYRTKVIDKTVPAFTNTGAGNGVGTGPVTVNNAANDFSKAVAAIDHANQTVEWTLTIRPLMDKLTGVSVTETLPDGMLYDSLVSISPADAAYTITPATPTTSFTLTFAGDLEGQDYVFRFKTKLNYSTQNPGAISRDYTNTAVFRYEGGTTDGVTKTATATLDSSFAANGSKTGVLNRSEGTISWTLLINPLSKNLGSVTVSDSIPSGENHRLVSGISVKHASVAADGTVSPGADAAPTEYTEPNYDADMKNFSLVLTNVTTPYLITYTTELYGMRQESYSNTATVAGIQYQGSVDYPNHNNHISKASHWGRNQPYVTWTVTVNTALSEIGNAKVVDTIGAGHIFDESYTPVVTKGGQTLTRADAPGASTYAMEVGVPDLATGMQVVTYYFGDISEQVTISYRTNVTRNGELTVSNNVQLFGGDPNEEIDEDTRNQAVVIAGGSGTGTGELGSLLIQKIDSLSGSPLNGVEFDLYRRNANGSRTYLGRGVTSGNGELAVSNLNYADYDVVEIAPPDGYVWDAQTTTVTISIDDPNGIKVITIENHPTHVSISKTGITGGEELPGATLQVFDEDDNLIEEWVSTTTPHLISAKLIAGKTYTLREITAPDGYVLAEEIEFTVSEDGSVDEVTMEDDWTKVSISKVTITGGPELPGAHLQIVDEDGEVVEEWVSTDKPYLIEAKLIAGKTYKLIETTAPNGYVVAEEITFTVSEDGSIDAVEMLDDPTDVTISKQAITGGAELPGATLKLVDAKGNLIDTWVSGTTPYRIVAKLIAGETYTLIEEAAPKGYLIADSITFKVNLDGTPQTITMFDDFEESELPETGDDANMALWIGIMAGSLALIAAAVVFIRKKETVKPKG